MYPILFSIGGLNIPSYTVLLNLGIVLGLVVTYFEGKRLLQNGLMALDLGLWTVIGGIIGGRIGFVLTKWVEFSEDWPSVLRIWEGGLAFHAAFLGGAVVVLIFAQIHSRRGQYPSGHQHPSGRQQQVTLWRLCDVLTPGLALGLVFGWAACLMGGCAYGITGEGFGFVFLPDLYGVGASRFATQAAGLALSLVLFLIVWLLRKRWSFPGAAFWTFTLLYFSGHFFLELLRGDEMLYVGPWRLGQWVDLVVAAVAAVVLMILWWRARTAPEEPQQPIRPEPRIQPGEKDWEFTEHVQGNGSQPIEQAGEHGTEKGLTAE